MAIEFVGFTADHRITGRLPLADDRLSDMLNAVARVVIRGAACEEIDTGRILDGDIMIAVGDLLVVVANGRRGIQSQRKRTGTRHIRVGLARYVVDGQLHTPLDSGGPAGAGDLEEVLAGRDLLVPLTGASVTYDRAGRLFEEAGETLLVNRALVRWFESGTPADDIDEATAEPDWAGGLIGVEPSGLPSRRGWAGQLRGVVGR